MYNFGRFLTMYSESPYYNQYMSYTGWFPDSREEGQGMASIDGTVY